MEALSLAILLTFISITIALTLWIPLSLKIRVRRTEVYLSGESQKHFPLSVAEASWAVRRVFEKLYSALIHHVQTGIFNDWFAFSLPYLLLLIVLLVIVVSSRGGV